MRSVFFVFFLNSLCTIGFHLVFLKLISIDWFFYFFVWWYLFLYYFWYLAIRDWWRSGGPLRYSSTLHRVRAQTLSETGRILRRFDFCIFQQVYSFDVIFFTNIIPKVFCYLLQKGTTVKLQHKQYEHEMYKNFHIVIKKTNAKAERVFFLIAFRSMRGWTKKEAQKD